MTKTTKTQTQIQQAVIYRCTCKETHEVFYMVKSDSTDEHYKVIWDEKAASWRCNCKSVKPCKHERAVREVQVARRELKAIEYQREFRKHIEAVKAEAIEKAADLGEYKQIVRKAEQEQEVAEKYGLTLEQVQDALALQRERYNMAFDPCLVA